MNERNEMSSFTIGTPGNKGSIKIYFDIDNFKAANGKIARGLLLYTKFVEGELTLEELKNLAE